MTLPSEQMFLQSQFTGDSSLAVLATTPLATKKNLLPGMYLLFCEAAIRWKQGPAGIGFTVTPGTPTVVAQGTPGAVTYTYKIVSRSGTDQKSAAGAAGSVTDGHATLDVTNFNRITWSAVAVGAEGGFDIYRTVGGATQGRIGQVGAGVLTFDDTGLVANGATAPATTETIGHRLPANTFFGPVFVSDSSNAYFDAKSDSATPTLEFLPTTG